MTSVFKGFYKTRTSSTQNATMQERMEVADNIRRESRWTALLQRRNITAFMSPINSPHVSAKKSVKKEVKNDRFAQLMKWKEQKKKQMETMKANAKPIFKVCRVKEALRPDLSEIYGKIKGKETFKLACSSTHKFKPPSNVKPLNVKTEHTNANVKRRLNFKDDLEGETSKSSKLNNNSTKKKKLKSPKVKMGDVIEEKIPTLVSISTRNSTKKIKNTKVEMINVEEPILSSEESTNNTTQKLQSPKANVTPIQLKKIPGEAQMTSPVKDIVYISPFITISRGKENSRREYHERRNNIYESPTISGSQKNTTPKAAAAFFENLLRREEQRLNEVCSNWKAYEDSENPPEEACDMIRMAIGQTKLLLRKEFGKFRELISECRCPTSDKIVTCLDLHGFWDIITIQINNLDGRFENLDRLKISNREEIVPFLLEQRKRNVRKENNNLPMVVVTTPRGRLLNISNTMFPQSDTITPITLRRKNTPKSILKSEHSPKNRSIRKTKSVLFRDSEEKENVFESSDLIQFTPETSISKIKHIGRKEN